MTATFRSKRHQGLFTALLRELRGIGYRDDLLRENYHFSDWFQAENPPRVAPAAAFGQIPQTYSSACFGVLVPNGKCGAELVAEYRALGAPFAFEVSEDVVTHWSVGSDVSRTARIARYNADELPRAFADRKDEWSALSVLRAKNIAFKAQTRQLDFFDAGLIPALETHIREKLDPKLREVLHKAKLAHRESSGADPNDQDLFRLVFRFLAAKVLHDRRRSGFESLSDANVNLILERVSEYYGETEPLLADQRTRQTAGSLLWNTIDFQNLSVEVLAYIYEHTLVDEESRRHHGTHSTPYSIARYIVHQLPFDQVDADSRYVVEPCSGHGIFLVASLQRMRDLLDPTLDFQKRHEYFVRMLSGFEIDHFALEVSKLSLVLADFPNKNSWRLYHANVFDSPPLAANLSQARFVVANPPFEAFTPDERLKYTGLRSIQKPAELLHRVLDALHPEGSIGIVLPHQVIAGDGYRDIRKRLATRFARIDVLSLPDRVFNVSQAESAVVIATEPRVGLGKSVRVRFSEVDDGDRMRFLQQYEVSRTDETEKSIEEVRSSFSVPPFREVWERLQKYDTLGSFAEIHRGLEWNDFDEDECYSQAELPNYRLGYARVAGSSVVSYVAPPALFIKMDDMRGNSFENDWNARKLFVNAVRLSRRGWRLAAFVDEHGYVGSQNFHGVWPKKAGEHSLLLLAAILNGPLASAFVSAFEGKNRKHNRITTMKRVPLPKLSEMDEHTICDLVRRYQLAASDAERVNLISAIDAAVLRGYRLPPRLERRLLDSFRGHQRPVPFRFVGFYPDDFTPSIPLWLYISSAFQKSTTSAMLASLPAITDPATLDALDDLR